jgi:hypothetical protein
MSSSKRNNDKSDGSGSQDWNTGEGSFLDNVWRGIKQACKEIKANPSKQDLYSEFAGYEG